MEQILQGRTLAEPLGQAGRGRMKTHFTMEKHPGKHTDAIEKAMNGKV